VLSKDKTRLCEAVDRFTARMKAKLLDKRDAGWSGWRQVDFIEGGGCKLKLYDHVGRLMVNDRGDHAVDIANFCMFLDDYWSKKEPDNGQAKA